MRGARPALMLVRAAAVALGALAGAALGRAAGGPLSGAVAGAVLGALAVGLEASAARLPLGSLLAGVLGGLLGLLAALPVAAVLVVLVPAARLAAVGLPAALGAYVGASIALRRRVELSAALLPGSGRGGGPRILDTSVIIDGRIADIAETGILDGALLVPRFVLGEIQHVADSGDALRRNRGKRGFEVLQRLQRSPRLRVTIDEHDFAGVAEVDSKLIELARATGGTILTNDDNLNRLAELSGVASVNLNEVANALKPAVLAGEVFAVQVLREGKEAGQGVGYLDDGTMVVVDQGRKSIGQTVEVEVTSVLQTTAGRMIFTRLRAEEVRGE